MGKKNETKWELVLVDGQFELEEVFANSWAVIKPKDYKVNDGR